MLNALLTIRWLARDAQAREELRERLGDAAAELWPEGPPLPEDLTDEQYLLVVERAVKNAR